MGVDEKDAGLTIGLDDEMLSIVDELVAPHARKPLERDYVSGEVRESRRRQVLASAVTAAATVITVCVGWELF